MQTAHNTIEIWFKEQSLSIITKTIEMIIFICLDVSIEDYIYIYVLEEFRVMIR